MSSVYEYLLENTEEERNALLSIPFIQEGWRGNLSLESYLAFLGQAFHHVKHTTPLLMACGSRVPFEKEWLRNAMAEYVEEEVGHQEWILSDIQHAGGDAQAVRHATPSLAVEAMIAYAYYVIERVNPIGFLGMVLVLEGTSIKVATEAAEAIKSSLGLGDECFSYLSSHGSLDISHMDFYKNLVNQIESEEDKVFLLHCAKNFFKLYGDVFRSLPLNKLSEI